jgi:D-alanyl-D-alanine carboxypeptidase
MRLATGAILLCLASGPSFARAQDAPGSPEPVKAAATTSVSEDIDAYVQRLMAKRHIPGVSIAVVQGGQVVLAKGYGLASVELGVPATENTVYQLASVTKPFTATAIMLLVEEGKLGLDDQLTERLPDLPKAWETITVRHLLSHTSGIKNLTNLPIFRETIRKDFTPRELVERVAKEPLEFQPGEKWGYSNTNYILLGMVIEKASGRTYGEFMAERIFKPLGMTSTRANDLHAVIPGRAQGYTWNGKELRIGEYHSATQPFAAGMLVTTVADLVKWDAALDSGALLGKSVLDPMWTPTRLSTGKTANYGLGWEIGVVNGHRMVSHGGGIPGFSTQLSRFPDDKLTVIVLTNSDGGQSTALARGIAARFVSELAEKAEPIEDKDTETTERLRGVFERAQKGEIDTELFTDEAKKQLVPHIREDKDRLVAFGALKEFQLLERKEGDEGVRLRYRAVFEKETLTISVALDKAAKIQGMGLRPED